MRRRSEPDAALHISISCPGKWRGSAPLSASHTSAILRLEPMTTRRPSGLRAALLTSALMDGQSARQLGAALRVPNSRRPVLRGRYNAKAIPTENGTDDPTLMAGDNAAPVRAEADTSHPILVAGQAAQFGAAFRIPHPRRLVLRRGNDPPPVRAEDRADHSVLVAGQAAKLGTALSIPHSRQLIPRSGNDPPPVRAEGRADHSGVAANQAAQLGDTLRMTNLIP